MNDDKPVSDLLDDFQRKGLYGFDRSNVEAALPVSTAAVGKALKRLSEKGRVIRLRKGFHAIVPVEFAIQGIPPSDWYLDDLMRSLDLPYYIGLLSAAALHGAAHQQVQQLQIVVPRLGDLIRENPRAAFLYARYDRSVGDAEMKAALNVSKRGFTLDNIELMDFLRELGADYAREAVRLEHFD